MELKGVSLMKSGNQKKIRAKAVLDGNGNGVVSCREEGGGVVRMKIVLRKSELKQLVEVMNGVKSTMSVEQRLNLLWRKKYVFRGNRNTHKCWTPVLQTIPEEKLF